MKHVGKFQRAYYLDHPEALTVEGHGTESLSPETRRIQAEVWKELRERRAVRGGARRTRKAVAADAERTHAQRSNVLFYPGVEGVPPQGSGESTTPCTEVRPWYVEADPIAFRTLHEAELNGTIGIIQAIDEYSRARCKDKTALAQETAAALGMRLSTFYEKRKTLHEARWWNDRLIRETGTGYPYLEQMAMCRKPSPRDKFPSLTEEQRAIVSRVWFGKQNASNQIGIPLAYDLCKEEAERLGVTDPFPCCETVRRYIEWMMQQPGNEEARFLAANGRREFARKKMVKARLAPERLQVLEAVEADAHTFDLFVSVKATNGRLTAIRPVVVALIDIRSRMLLGSMICQTSNSQIVKQAVFNMIYAPGGGVPKVLRLDNGKDFTGETNTGQKRNMRNCTLDSETVGYYRSLGIEAWSRATPYRGWSKAHIERSFRTVIERFSKRFASYIGTLTGSKTESKRPKNIQQMLERGELLTLEEFTEQWEVWLRQEYEIKAHRGLKEQGEPLPTPQAVFADADRYVGAMPSREYALSLLLKGAAAKVGADGSIRKFSTLYTAEELSHYAGRWVNVRWDEKDISSLLVTDQKTGTKICDAVSQEFLTMQPGENSEAVMNHLRRQNRQIREAAEKQREMENPEILLERIADATPNAPDGQLAGVGKVPKRAKLEKLPQDKEWRESRLGGMYTAKDRKLTEADNRQVDEILKGLCVV